MNKRGSIVSIVLAAAVAAACAGTGARNRIVFDGARYPVSLSSYVHGPDGQLLGPDQLESLGTFELRQREWATVWGLVPLNTIDFSNGVNARVEELGGEAVVDLELQVEDSLLNWSLFLHWFPVWPGTGMVETRGTVVRRAGR